MRHSKLWAKLEAHTKGEVVKVTSCETSDRIDGVVTTIIEQEQGVGFTFCTHMFIFESDTPSLFWGHYDMSRGEAIADHHERANNL